MVEAAATIYDETYVIGGGGLTAGTAITLPASGTYTDKDLKVYFNGILIAPGAGEDYQYVGSPLRTQITLNFDALAGEKVRFKLGD